MKKILLSGAVAMLLIGCGDTKLDKEDVVCVFDHPVELFGIVSSQESVFSCTNKAGEQISGMTEVSLDNKKRDIRRLWIKDGLVVRYERDYQSGNLEDFKQELFFENGRFVKKVEDGKEQGWDLGLHSFIVGSIGSASAGIPTPKQ